MWTQRERQIGHDRNSKDKKKTPKTDEMTNYKSHHRKLFTDNTKPAIISRWFWIVSRSWSTCGIGGNSNLFISFNKVFVYRICFLFKGLILKIVLQKFV